MWRHSPMVELTLKCLRVIGIVGLLLCIVIPIGHYKVRANTDERLFSLGAHMMTYAGASNTRLPHAMIFNGEALTLAVTTTQDPLDQTLDHYRKTCQKHGLTSEHSTSPPPVSKWQYQHLLAEPTLLEKREASRGFIACFDLGTQTSNRRLSSWIERLKTFTQSGDLADVGGLRFVYAETTSTGTRLVSAWTEGRFRLSRLLPPSGDVPESPGVQPNVLKRLPGSRRTLDMIEKGQPFRVQVYTHPTASPTATLEHYTKQLTAQGFSLSQPEGDPLLHVANRRDMTVVTHVTPHNQGGSSVTLLIAQ